jgi:hypothetical protein
MSALSPANILRSVLYKRFFKLDSNLPFIFRVQLVARNDCPITLIKAGEIIASHEFDLQSYAKNVSNVSVPLYTDKCSVLEDDRSNIMAGIIYNAMYMFPMDKYGNYSGDIFYHFYIGNSFRMVGF